MNRRNFIVLGCFVGLAVSISSVFFVTLPVFLRSIVSQTGWSRTEVISAISICNGVGLLSSPFIGRLVGRFGPRRVIGLSIVPFGVSLMVLGQVGNSYLLFCIVSVAVGFFGNFTNTFVYLSFLPRWFEQRIGLRFAVAASGIGFGQTLMPILAFRMMEAIGWNRAIVVLGATTIAVAGLTSLLILRDSPKQAVASGADVSKVSNVGVSRAEAMDTPEFWRLIASFFFVTTAVVGTGLNLVPILTDRGVSLKAAASLASLTGFSVLASRLLAGAVLDLVAVSTIARVIFLGAAVGTALIWLQLPLVTYFVAIPLVGISLGSEGDVMAYVVKRVFGNRAYAEIYGYLWSAFLAGAVVGPIALSKSYDIFNSYEPMLFVYAVFAVAAALLMPAVPRGSYSHKLTAAPSKKVFR